MFLPSLDRLLIWDAVFINLCIFFSVHLQTVHVLSAFLVCVVFLWETASSANPLVSSSKFSFSGHLQILHNLFYVFRVW